MFKCFRLGWVSLQVLASAPLAPKLDSWSKYHSGLIWWLMCEQKYGALFQIISSKHFYPVVLDVLISRLGTLSLWVHKIGVNAQMWFWHKLWINMQWLFWHKLLLDAQMHILYWHKRWFHRKKPWKCTREHNNRDLFTVLTLRSVLAIWINLRI